MILQSYLNITIHYKLKGINVNVYPFFYIFAPTHNNNNQ
ncbi:hypothetical protein PHEL85_2664 [Polaribacter sp. Hel1_85]|nr:hypothetical protein PHEL85_2664 [Polaribacter sp. Hel1_85]